jgi:uncharacterized protein DUF4262
MSNDDMQMYMAKVRTMIEKHGWIIQGVTADRRHPMMHYTVGLWPTVGFELITIGLPETTGRDLLNTLARRVLDGVRFTHGEVRSDILAGYEATMIEIPQTGDYMGVANRLYRLDGVNIPAWQLVYPDAEHRWPWDAGSKVSALPVYGRVPS